MCKTVFSSRRSTSITPPPANNVANPEQQSCFVELEKYAHGKILPNDSIPENKFICISFDSIVGENATSKLHHEQAPRQKRLKR